MRDHFQLIPQYDWKDIRFPYFTRNTNTFFKIMLSHLYEVTINFQKLPVSNPKSCDSCIEICKIDQIH